MSTVKPAAPKAKPASPGAAKKAEKKKLGGEQEGPRMYYHHDIDDYRPYERGQKQQMRIDALFPTTKEKNK